MYGRLLHLPLQRLRTDQGGPFLPSRPYLVRAIVFDHVSHVQVVQTAPTRQFWLRLSTHCTVRLKHHLLLVLLRLLELRLQEDLLLLEDGQQRLLLRVLRIAKFEVLGIVRGRRRWLLG